MGDGLFVEDSVANEMVLRPDPVHPKKGRIVHGCVEPATKMSLDRLQELLAQTRSEWTVDEE
jgi:hypothetical protein